MVQGGMSTLLNRLKLSDYNRKNGYEPQLRDLLAQRKFGGKIFTRDDFVIELGILLNEINPNRSGESCLDEAQAVFGWWARRDAIYQV